MNYQQTTYFASATALSQLPKDYGAEVAFIGRSNAGKSSAINAIVNITGLARTSRTPGRTQMVNFFKIDDRHRLVDLPGYGFAKTTGEQKRQWEEMTADYLEARESLRGLILVMDARHPLKPMDQEMIQWCVDCETPVHILLTKTDKLTPNEQKKTLFLVEKTISILPDVSVQLFSSLKKTGVDAARRKLDEWLD